MTARIEALRLTGVAGVLLGFAAGAAAQDIEMSAMVRGRPLPSGYFDRVALEPDFFDVRHGWAQRARAASATNTPLAGTLPIVVILAQFADSPTSSVSTAELERILFDGPNPDGTLTDFYRDQSQGLLQVQGRVFPWVRGSLTVAQVRGASFGLGSDARTGEFYAEVVAMADRTLDFGAFDNDGPDNVPNSGDDDGIVDALAIEFLEAAVTCSGQGPTIWGHRSRLSNWNGEPYTTDDVDPDGNPIIVDDYMTQAAVRCDGRPQTTVVIAHEFGHILGLPDLYDSAEGILPEQRNWVVGCWSIMAAGQWGCGPALAEGRWATPPHFGPWEKDEFGWLPDMIVPGDVLDEEVVLRPVESTGDVLRLDLAAGEYLLVEYRDGSGFDKNLPATGVLVHHVDLSRTTGNRRCRTCPRLYRAALVEADADASLLTPEGQGGSRGEAGDVFARTGVARLTNTTNPSTRLNSGAPSDVSVYHISVDDGLATVRFSTRTIPLDRLLDRFLDTGAGELTAEERQYLDELGNGNGRYDVGDLQVYLAGHPSVTARGRGGDTQ